MNYSRLREKVIQKFYPGDEDIEEIEAKYEEISGFIEDKFGRETHFAGSAGRGTCMNGDRDIDVFVLFEEDLSEKELENQGLEIGKKVFDEFGGEFQIDYAEHPYVKGEIDDHEVEIVPCYETDPEDIKSSVDRTPHHSQWVKENLDKDQRKDVVMLKRFLQGEGIYGSSLKVRGFSGYLCEVLIGEFGSFEALVEEAVDWDREEVIDPEDQHEEGLPQELEDKFENDSLVVIDPVDPERNVASVLSSENYAKFIYRCWDFERDPGIDFFEEEETEYTEFEVKQEVQKRADFLVLEFESIDEVEDIVYPQMRKALSRLEKSLEKKEFTVFECGFHVGEEETRIFFELRRKLPDNMKQKGPRVFHGREHLEQFTSKYDNVFVEGDRLVAKTEREFNDARELLQDFLEEELEEKGIPGNVAEKIEEYSFVDPLEVDDDSWFNYLGEKLHVDKNKESE